MLLREPRATEGVGVGQKGRTKELGRVGAGGVHYLLLRLHGVAHKVVLHIRAHQFSRNTRKMPRMLRLLAREMLHSAAYVVTKLSWGGGAPCESVLAGKRRESSRARDLGLVLPRASSRASKKPSFSGPRLRAGSRGRIKRSLAIGAAPHEERGEKGMPWRGGALQNRSQFGGREQFEGVGCGVGGHGGCGGRDVETLVAVSGAVGMRLAARGGGAKRAGGRAGGGR